MTSGIKNSLGTDGADDNILLAATLPSSIFFVSTYTTDITTLPDGGVWWDVFGSNGTIYATNVQASVNGGGNAIGLNGSGNILALYGTQGIRDAVFGSGAKIYLDSAQVNIEGGGNEVGFVGSGDVASFYFSGSQWNAVYGSEGTIYLDDARANVEGGGNVIGLFGDDVLILLNTGGHPDDQVYGSNQTIYLYHASASVTGSGNTIGFTGSNDRVILSGTVYTSWDSVFGSNGDISLLSAQAHVEGGGNVIDLAGAGSEVAIYGTNGVADDIHCEGQYADYYDYQFIYVNSAQANIFSGSGEVHCAGAGDEMSLNNFRGNVSASNTIVRVNDGWPHLVGSNNTVYLSSTTNRFVSIYGGGNSVYASSEAVALLGDATIYGSGNGIDFVGEFGVRSSSSVKVVGGSQSFYFFSYGIRAILIPSTATIEGFDLSDKMIFSKQSFTDWSALQQAITQDGSDTLINMAYLPPVRLVGVDANSLTQSNFQLI